MKIRRSPAWIAILLPTLWPACASEEASPGEMLPAEERTADGVIELSDESLELGGIRVEESRRSRIPLIVEVAGRIGVNENRTSRVGALADGRIAQVIKNVGDRVASGTVMALLRSYRVDETRARIAMAGAELERALSELELIRNARDRAARLHDLKAGSLRELQEAEADLRRAESNVLVVRAEIGSLKELLNHWGISAEGALEEYTIEGELDNQAHQAREQIPIVSPLDGIVMERMVTPGSVVSPSDDLFVVSDLSSLWVHGQLPEIHLSRMRVGQKVRVRVDAYPGRDFGAVLSYVGNVLDPATRTVRVRCETPNREGLLRPEMYATVIFDLESGDDVLAVPTGALQSIDGERVVFVEFAPRQFEARPVRVGRISGDSAVIEEGLEEGERVVTEGSFLLKSELLKGQIEEE